MPQPRFCDLVSTGDAKAILALFNAPKGRVDLHLLRRASPLSGKCHGLDLQCVHTRKASDAVLLQGNRRGGVSRKRILLAQRLKTRQKKALRFLRFKRHLAYRNSRTGTVQERTISVVVLPTIIVRSGLCP
jgi:hypothetical protein